MSDVTVSDLVEALGPGKAATLLHEWGGCEIYLTEKTDLKVLGPDANEQLIDYFGSGRFRLPIACLRGVDAERRQAKRKACMLLAEGRSVRYVAQRVGVHERTIYRYKAELGLIDDEQPTLF